MTAWKWGGTTRDAALFNGMKSAGTMHSLLASLMGKHPSVLCASFFISGAYFACKNRTAARRSPPLVALCTPLHLRPRKSLMKIRSALTSIFSVIALGIAAPACADYAFSGTGTSGNISSAFEGWSFNNDGGIAVNGLANNWGSPGVGAGSGIYVNTDTAFGFDITFTGGSGFLSGSIATGNSANCAGSTSGGTTFCTISPINIWTATQIDNYTVAFRAQDAAYYLSNGQTYFVNIFFAGDTPDSFSGKWVTTFAAPLPESAASVPEPSTLVLLGLGLAGFAATRRRPV